MIHFTTIHNKVCEGIRTKISAVAMIFRHGALTLPNRPFASMNVNVLPVAVYVKARTSWRIWTYHSLSATPLGGPSFSKSHGEKLAGDSSNTQVQDER